MTKVRNNPSKYVTRAAKLPVAEGDANSCTRRVEERERSYREAPIDKGFYIDHRKPVQTKLASSSPGLSRTATRRSDPLALSARDCRVGSETDWRPGSLSQNRDRSSD